MFTTALIISFVLAIIAMIFFAIYGDSFPDKEFENKTGLTQLEKVSLDLTVGISYQDARGKRTNRNITMKSLFKSEKDEDYMIQAFCHDVQSVRTFKMSKIKKAWQIESGHAIPDIKKYISHRIKK